MLSELSAELGLEKFRDLQKRLDHTNTKTALAAEAELAVLWAVSQVAQLTPEPVLPSSSHKPDAESRDLFSSGPAVIEVRALSDDSFSGKEAMDRTANIISGYADQIRKGAGKYLYFQFGERSYWASGFHRERSVDPSFQLDPEIKTILRHWIAAPDWPNPSAIRLTHGKTDVVISPNESPLRLYRTFCTMPAVAYDLEDNPIYKALKKKASQIKGAEAGTLRCAVLVDVGCSLLRRLQPIGAQEIGGETIIRYSLRKLSIDLVIVLSPYRQRELGFAPRSRMLWYVHCFDTREGPQNLLTS